MITYKLKEFSEDLVSKMTEALDKEKIYDYDVSDKVEKDSISITGTLNNIEIWIPRSYEFSQYSIDDCIREMLPYAYTDTRQEGNFFKMTVKSRLTPSQYLKLLKFIIKETEFVNIISA